VLSGLEERIEKNFVNSRFFTGLSQTIATFSVNKFSQTELMKTFKVA
jgi:hypothetical protein